jgi:hypothetical protein
VPFYYSIRYFLLPSHYGCLLRGNKESYYPNNTTAPTLGIETERVVVLSVGSEADYKKETYRLSHPQNGQDKVNRLLCLHPHPGFSPLITKAIFNSTTGRDFWYDKILYS